MSYFTSFLNYLSTMRLSETDFAKFLCIEKYSSLMKKPLLSTFGCRSLSPSKMTFCEISRSAFSLVSFIIF